LKLSVLEATLSDQVKEHGIRVVKVKPKTKMQQYLLNSEYPCWALPKSGAWLFVVCMKVAVDFSFRAISHPLQRVLHVLLVTSSFQYL